MWSRKDIDVALKTFTNVDNPDPEDETHMSVTFINCSGFLRICRNYFLRDLPSTICVVSWSHSSLYLTFAWTEDVLDDTRIHPVDYFLADLMASGAFDEEDNDDEDNEGRSKIEAVMGKPDMLKDIGINPP